MKLLKNKTYMKLANLILSSLSHRTDIFILKKHLSALDRLDKTQNI